MPPGNDSDESEVELTATIAGELISVEHPRPEITDLTQIDHWRGETYTVSLADGTAYVIKLFPDVDAEQVLKEANVYRRIATETGVPVPAVIATDEDATYGPCPSFVLEYVDGRHIDALDVFSPDDQDRLLEELGAHYGSIHQRVTCDRFGLVGASADAPFENMATETWKEWFDRQVDGRLEALTESRFADLLPRASAFVDDRRSTLERAFDPVLLQDDYGLGNVLVAPDRDPLIRAVLDFERAIAGPAEHGFIKAEWSLTRGTEREDSLQTAFREGYADYAPIPDAPELDRRSDLYRLEALLNEMLFTNIRAETGRMSDDELEKHVERIHTRFETIVEN